MSARPGAIATLTLLVWCGSHPANAQHGKEKPASAAVATGHTAPAKEHAAAAEHPEKTAAAKAEPKAVEKAVAAKAGTSGEADGEKVAPTTTTAAPPGSREAAPKKDDLKGALDRIDLEIAEMKKTPRPARATTSAAPTAAAVPRVKLLWRTALSWPPAIGGTENGEAHEENRAISLTWR